MITTKTNVAVLGRNGTLHILLCISITLLLSAYRGCKYSGYEKFILVLEVDCISNLSPNHTLQLTTLRTAMSKSLQRAFVVILSQRLLHLQDNGYYCMLFDVHAGVTSSKDA